MWYTGNNGTNKRILTCESDNGKSWTNFKLAVNIGASGLGYDSTHVQSPVVIKDDDKYKMWYSGNNGTNFRILYCESNNGVRWTNYKLAVNFGASGLGYDSTHAQGSAVIKDGGKYKMWYTGNNGTNAITLYCESSNGLNWQNFKLSVNINSSGTGLDTTRLGGPSVVNDRGVGKMWYHASNDGGTTYQILYAESR